MPVNPEAIERFLNAPVPAVPDYKGLPLGLAYRHIESLVGSIAFKMQPRELQVKSLAFALRQQRALLLLRPRMGKTKVVLDYATGLRQSGQWRGKGIIITPSPIVNSVWEMQVPEHSDLKVHAIYETKDAWLRALDKLDAGADLVVVSAINVKATFARPKAVKRGKRALEPDPVALVAASEFFDLCAIDEIHTLADPNSLGFKCVWMLVQRCKFRLGLTGTPFHKDPYKLWAQAYLLDGGSALGRNYHFFTQAFGKLSYSHFKRKKEEWVFDPKKLPALRAKLAPLAISYTWDEVGALNMKQRPITLTMGRAQRELYAEALEEVIKSKGDEKVTSNSFVRWRQIASGFIMHDGTPVDIPGSVKQQWVENYFTTEWNGEQVLIFHDYTYSGKCVAGVLAKLKIKHFWLNGKVLRALRAPAVAAFQSGACPVLVLQQQVGGTGLDLSAADYTIFYESPVSGIAREQCEMRPMASSRGNRPLLIDDLICSRVEERILAGQSEGRSLLDGLIGNKDLLKLL